MMANHRLYTSSPLLIALIWVGLCGFLDIRPAIAQPDVPNHTWEVYLEQDIDITGLDRLLFIDVLMGDIVTVEVYGERYTPMAQHILFYNPRRGEIAQVGPDGIVTQHPFIRLDGAQRVDWAVTDDGRNIAWTLTYGEADALTTVTYAASADGANWREVLRDGPREGLRALPLSFSPDNTRLYMDAHPDGLARFSAYTQYAGLFSVDLSTGDIASLPGEPGCYCGAGLRSDLFLRLALASDLRGFDVQVYDLSDLRLTTIPALSLDNYTQAGDIRISPDGTRAIYALSQIENFGAIDQTINTVFMLVDLRNLSQRRFAGPIDQLLRPIRWTEDNTAILFTNPQQPGTWKIDIASGNLQQVADVAYLGTVQS